MEFSPEQPAAVNTSTLDMEVQSCLNSACTLSNQFLIFLFWNTIACVRALFRLVSLRRETFSGDILKRVTNLY